MYKSISNTCTMSLRCLRLSFRNLDVLIISAVMPIILMLLFVFILGAGAYDRQEYINFLVPSVIILSVGYCSTLTAGSINSDMKKGIIDRFRSMPLFHPSVLAGHVAASAIRTCISTILVLGVAVLIGFRPAAGILAWLGVAGILFLFMLVITWVSVFFGLIANTPEGAGAFGFVMLFLPYLSSGFTPLETLPTPIRAFATHQPLTPIIESLRGLTMGAQVNGYILAAVIWCGVLLTGAYAAANFVYRRRVG